MNTRAPAVPARTLTAVGAVALLLLPAARLQAMSAPEHLFGNDTLGGLRDLRGTTPSAGGVGDKTADWLESLDDWMDNPATKPGAYTNRKAGGRILAPANHGALRHNPLAVARVYSGNGTIDPQALNAARLHKIQDIAHNSMPVDGWEITPARRRSAQDMLAHVKTHGRLPVKLPQWVDESGPLITRGGRMAANVSDDAARAAGRAAASSSDDVARTVARTAGSSADDAGRGIGYVLVKKGAVVSKVAVPLAVAVQIGLAGHDIYRTEADFAAGRITEAERFRRHSRQGASLAGGTAGAIAGGALATLVPIPGATIVGVVVGSVAGDWVAGRISDAAWELYARAAEERRLADVAALGHIYATCGDLTLGPEDYAALGFSRTETEALASVFPSMP